MMTEAGAAVTEAALKSSELAVREAVAEHGQQHPEVLKRLERFIVLLRRAGRETQADKLTEKANTLRQLLAAKGQLDDSPQPGATAGSANPAGKPSVMPGSAAAPAEASRLIDRPLFNSRGEHIAMEVNGHLYSPDGKYIGYWSSDMEAYISKEGHYIGQIVEDNRLARDPSWRFRHLTFGRGYEGDRTGWQRVGDVERVVLPYGFEDAEL